MFRLPLLLWGFALPVVALAGDLRCDELLYLHDVVIPRLEQTGLEMRRDLAQKRRELEARSGPPPHVAFFEAMDSALRFDARFPKTLFHMALRRLPYLRERPFNLVLSGGTIQGWKPVLEAAAVEEGVGVRFLLLPGNLSDQPHRPPTKLAPPNAETAALLTTGPTIFLDDSFSSGGSAQAVNLWVDAVDGKLDGVFVVYESGAGETSAIYRSGRAGPHGGKAFRSYEEPDHWTWVPKHPEIALGLTDAMTIWNGSLTRNGARLLAQLEANGVTVIFQSAAGPVSAPPSVVAQFPRLKTAVHAGPYPVALGNWGRNFVGFANGVNVPSADISVQTVPIHYSYPPPTPHPLWPPKVFVEDEYGLSTTYFLDRLTEVGVLVPTFAPRELPEKKDTAIVTLDLRP